MSCHRDGGEAPFPLETHAQVEAKLSAMIYVVEADTMPPVGYAHHTETEGALLLEWLNEGAPLGSPDDAPALPVSQFTYHRDIRSILERRCVQCHETDGIAPFPLESLQDVRGVAAAAAFSIDNGTMPPWPPTAGYTPFKHERNLDDAEKYALTRWLKSDMPEGDPADYVAPELPVQESVNFNIELQLPQAYTPTLLPDDHRCFAIPWPEDEFTYVTAVDVRPDVVAQVHHVIVSIAEPEDADLYYAAGGEDGHPGWYCLGAGGVSGAPLPRQIGGWVPGAGREPQPRNTGIGVKPGSVMVVQMHYNTLATEPAPDQSDILVATSDEVERPAHSFLLTNPSWLQDGVMHIPAGDPNVHHSWEVPTGALSSIFGSEIGLTGFDPWVIHQGFLHMHNLGKSGRTTLIRSDGTEQVLLDIRDWDFNWQSTFNFDREVLVNPGDTIRLECYWDNSQANQEFVNGEQLQTSDVDWGDGTQDEMCLMSVMMTAPQDGYDYTPQVNVRIESPSYRQQFVPGDLVPLQLVLNNFSLHDPGEHNHDDASMHMTSMHTDANDDHSSVYEGHYHLYLNTDDDDAEHLTAWDPLYYYELPADIEPGIHTLRLSLRGADHHALGIEREVEIEVVEDFAEARLRLTEVNAWTPQTAGQDAFPDHRPTEINCPANSYYAEGDALEVETGYCNYLSLVQPSLSALQSGDTVHLVLWHGDLRAAEAAQGHVAISIDGNLLWEATVDIPADAQIFDLRIPVEFDAPQGAEIEYHLHNHGFNSWTILQLEIER
ncbi:hypothetical protein [Halioglobus maricola]|uniref:monooxygenase n=1 Tax=Halioglobus maricola TaxID=2601894 RepID=UPI0014789F50|nr:hypothetical protein [Halioglobus maricola]